jgi:hypothetical protein
MPKSPLDQPGIFQQALIKFTRSGADAVEGETGTTRVTGEIITLRVNVGASAGSGNANLLHYGNKSTGSVTITILEVNGIDNIKTLPKYIYPGNQGSFVYLDKKKKPDGEEMRIRLDGIARGTTHPIIAPLIGQKLSGTVEDIGYGSSFKIA